MALKLMDTKENAEFENRKGVARLLRLSLAAQFKQLEKDLGRQTALALKYRPFGNAESFFTELLDTIANRACLGDDELPRKPKEFDRQKERAKPRVAPVTQALLKSVEEVLELYQQLQAKLAQKSPFAHAQKDEQAHLARLDYSAPYPGRGFRALGTEVIQRAVEDDWQGALERAQVHLALVQAELKNIRCRSAVGALGPKHGHRFRGRIPG